MRGIACLLVLLACAPTVNCRAAGIDTQSVRLCQLAGTWKLVKWEAKGNDILKVYNLPEPPPWRFEGNKLFFDKGAHFMIVSLSQTGKVKEIDLTFNTEQGKETYKGIYSLDHDELKIAFASKHMFVPSKLTEPGRKRPLSFDTQQTPEKGFTVSLLVLKRIKR